MLYKSQQVKEEQIAARFSRLHAIEAEAAKGLKLHKVSDRIRAALDLTRAWQEAKSRGLAKAVFERRVLDGLSWDHGGRRKFRLNRYTLKRAEVDRLSGDGITSRDVAIYAKLREPQKSLDAYLVGIKVAAEHCGANPDEWAIAMLSKTTLWTAQPSSSANHSETSDLTREDDEPADIPAETLAILLDRLARYLASTNKLPELMADILQLPCRWSMFDEKLVHSQPAAIDRFFAEMSPVNNTVYFEEMVPYPSVPLLRVPILHRSATLGIMPNGPLHADELTTDEASMVQASSTGLSLEDGKRRVFGKPPEGEIDEIEGSLVLYREVRLAIAPVDRHSWGAVLEFRPFIAVDLPDDEGDMIQYQVKNAYDPDLERVHYYPLAEEKRLVWPAIDRNGVLQRVVCLEIHDNTLAEPGALQELWASGMLTPDAPPEPWYLTYASVTALELKHWLAPEVDHPDGPYSRPWHHTNFSADAYADRLPPQHEFYFPFGEAVTDVESCLYNGLIQEALQTAIDRLAESARTLRSDIMSARERNAQQLLNQWQITTIN